MKIPKKLKIGGIVYKVEETELEDIIGGAAQAGVSYAENRITIYKHSTQAQKWQSLWHEIIHVFNTEIDEREVEFLAQAIYQVLVDNKLLRDK